MEEIIKVVLKKIKPTQKEEREIAAHISSMLNRVNKGLKGAKAVLGGSGVKGTWLKDAYDADIFIMYEKAAPNMSDLLEKHLKKKFKGVKRLHGSRDYFQIDDGGVVFEIVPIFKVKKADEAKNITDVSPLHAKWVNKHKRYRDEMRLLKQFCKGIGVYGAESHIRGLSGYACEILSVYFGSFLNCLRKAVKWEDKVVIDVEKYYKKGGVFRELNKSKLESPLILVDPVQKTRNAAAALSAEKFNRFVKMAKAFLKNPNEQYFFKSQMNITKRKGEDVFLLKIDLKADKEDILGCKVMKLIDQAYQELEKHGFNVKRKGFELYDGKGVGFIAVKKEVLSLKRVHEGPCVNQKDHVIAFKKKHKDTFIKGKRVYARVKRKYREAIDVIKSIEPDKRIKKIRIVRI